jgi:hypothetical protein
MRGDRLLHDFLELTLQNSCYLMTSLNESNAIYSFVIRLSCACRVLNYKDGLTIVSTLW